MGDILSVDGDAVAAMEARVLKDDMQWFFWLLK